ncbi:MAG TPA: hypothetical protein VGE07_03310 [Herpetosiphonaceae bacterium]
MRRIETLNLARMTWFLGFLVFVIGFITNRDSLIIAAGLAIAGGIISMALLTRDAA